MEKILTKVATGAGVAAGGVFNGSWTNEGNVRNQDDRTNDGDGLFATCAPAKNQEFASLWPFVFSEIDEDDTIASVTAKLQWKVSTTSSVATMRSTVFADSGGSPDQTTALSASPGFSNTSEPTAETTVAYPATCTAAQLRQGIWVRAQGLRGNSNTAVTFSLDYIQVKVHYFPPAPQGGSGGGAAKLGSYGRLVRG